MAKYRKRPVVVSEAVQVEFAKCTEDSFEGAAFDAMPPWMIQALQRGTVSGVSGGPQDCMKWRVATPTGEVTADVGDFILQNAGGDLSVVPAPAFVSTYELVEE